MSRFDAMRRQLMVLWAVALVAAFVGGPLLNGTAAYGEGIAEVTDRVESATGDATDGDADARPEDDASSNDGTSSDGDDDDDDSKSDDDSNSNDGTSSDDDDDSKSDDDDDDDSKSDDDDGNSSKGEDEPKKLPKVSCPSDTSFLKFDDDQIGHLGVSLSTDGVTVTITRWLPKDHDGHDYAGFSYRIDGGTGYFVVKAGQELFRGKSSPWVNPNGTGGRTVKGISHIVFCVQPDEVPQPVPSVDIEKATNGVDADTAASGPRVAGGSGVEWTYVVTNDGDVPLEDVRVTDDREAAVSCPGSRLAVGESMTCTARGTARVGAYENRGTVTATAGTFGRVTDHDLSHYSGAATCPVSGDHVIRIGDLLFNRDGDDVAGPFPASIPAGTYRVTLVSYDDHSLTPPKVAPNEQWFAQLRDAAGDLVYESPAISDLPDDEDWRIEVVDVAAVVTGGAASLFAIHARIGTALNSVVPICAVFDEIDLPDAGIDIEKATNGNDADTPDVAPELVAGEQVTWTYVVTNTGDTRIRRIVVTDDQIGPISCPLTELGRGESMTCTAVGTATNGLYANVGTVEGVATSTVGDEFVRDEDPSHYRGSAAPRPAIDIEKATNGVDADTPDLAPPLTVGSTVTWTYVVMNTGNVSLSEISVTDDPQGAVSCPQDALDIGESMTCTATGTVTEGLYANVGSVVGVDVDSNEVSDRDPSHYVGIVAPRPGIQVEKATDGVDADTPDLAPQVFVGEKVTWFYVVSNTGNVPLSGIELVDDQVGLIPCPSSTLGIGESMTCSEIGLGIDGLYANVATVTGADDAGTEVSDTDPSHYFGVVPAPGIHVEKATDGVDADTPDLAPELIVGDTVTWSYVVENTGNLTLTGIDLVDDQVGPINCPATALDAGESMACTATGTVSEGLYSNVATATGEDAFGTTVSDTDPSHYFGVVPQPGIDVEKATDGVDADTPNLAPELIVGDTVTWTYVVENTGNVALLNVALEDDQLGPITCPSASLPIAATMTCTATGTVAEGLYANVATATGADDSGTNVSDIDASHYVGVVPVPAIEVEKATNGLDADTPDLAPELIIGETVTWIYVVTNSGDLPLTGVALEDDQLGPITCPSSSLPVAATMTCTAIGTVTAGLYANIATATGEDAVGTEVSDSDPSHYRGVEPSIGIEKFVNGADADLPPGEFIAEGAPVEFTFVVTNLGTANLADVTVTDTVFGAVCTIPILVIGDTEICVVNISAAPGQHANTATASGQPIDAGGVPMGDRVEDTDPAHYFGWSADIDLEKATNGADADLPDGPDVPSIPIGTDVVWTYVVTNTGNVALSGIAVADD